jgi:hypothetical protein
MRVFIGFKYQTGGETPELRHVPVMYGDLSRQVANIIRENSENKMPTVPRIACYITNIELDTSRLSDATFVSKLHIRERDFNEVEGERVYKQSQGGNYTVERLMPTPYNLTLKADLWTSNTDQKLQLFEQIAVLFSPSIDLQTTDNYIDWTSLTTLYLKTTTFSSRTIPQGTESEIDVMSLEFETPIYLSPPAKVKKLGIVKNIIMNIFTEAGDLKNLEDLTFNGDTPQSDLRTTVDQFDLLLLRNPSTGAYEATVLQAYEAVLDKDGTKIPTKLYGSRVDWNKVLEMHGGYTPTSTIHFLQPNGFEISGTFAVNTVDPTYLIVDIDIDTIPTNTESAIDAIVDPYKLNPINKFGSLANIPVGIRYLMLDDVNNSPNVGGQINLPSVDSSRSDYDGPDGWKNLDGTDPVIKANSIITWTGSRWETDFDPTDQDGIKYVANLTTGIQYKWENNQWLKSFEGEYAVGYWRFDLNA